MATLPNIPLHPNDLLYPEEGGFGGNMPHKGQDTQKDEKNQDNESVSHRSKQSRNLSINSKKSRNLARKSIKTKDNRDALVPMMDTMSSTQ